MKKLNGWQRLFILFAIIYTLPFIGLLINGLLNSFPADYDHISSSHLSVIVSWISEHDTKLKNISVEDMQSAYNDRTSDDIINILYGNYLPTHPECEDMFKVVWLNANQMKKSCYLSISKWYFQVF